MHARIQGQLGLIIVAIFLTLQVGLFWLSMSVFFRISVFCTAPASSPWSLPFGILHLIMFLLLFVGLASLRYERLRTPYIIFVALGLMMLPIQAGLVSHDILRCDGP